MTCNFPQPDGSKCPGTIGVPNHPSDDVARCDRCNRVISAASMIAELRELQERVAKLQRERDALFAETRHAWDSANRMHKKLGGIAPWDGGPSLFEMNERALSNKLSTLEAATLERAAKVCEENKAAQGWALAAEIRSLTEKDPTP